MHFNPLPMLLFVAFSNSIISPERGHENQLCPSWETLEQKSPSLSQCYIIFKRQPNAWCNTPAGPKPPPSLQGTSYL